MPFKSSHRVLKRSKLGQIGSEDCGRKWLASVKRILLINQIFLEKKRYGEYILQRSFATHNVECVLVFWGQIGCVYTFLCMCIYKPFPGSFLSSLVDVCGMFNYRSVACRNVPVLLDIWEDSKMIFSIHSCFSRNVSNEQQQ